MSAGDHSGRRAVVTGGAHGIGAATAARLRDGGARVVVLDREAGTGPDSVVVDLAGAAAVVAAAEEALHRLGGVDALVNCAGVSLPQRLLALDLEAHRRTLAVNLTAPVLLMRELGGAMAAAGSGRIVNVTSVHARVGELASLAYDASKAGLEAATRTAALELADAGVLVNAVAPGYVRTRMSVVDGVDELQSEEFLATCVRGGRRGDRLARQRGQHVRDRPGAHRRRRPHREVLAAPSTARAGRVSSSPVTATAMLASARRTLG